MKFKTKTQVKKESEQSHEQLTWLFIIIGIIASVLSAVL